MPTEQPKLELWNRFIKLLNYLKLIWPPWTWAADANEPLPFAMNFLSLFTATRPAFACFIFWAHVSRLFQLLFTCVLVSPDPNFFHFFNLIHNLTCLNSIFTARFITPLNQRQLKIRKPKMKPLPPHVTCDTYVLTTNVRPLRHRISIRNGKCSVKWNDK